MLLINNIFLAVMDLLVNDLATVEDIDTAVKHSLGIRLPIVGVAQSLDFTGLDLVRDSARSFGLTFPIIEEKVAVVPGTAFGQCGEGYVRCCYATSLDEIKEALSRMKRFASKHRKV